MWASSWARIASTWIGVSPASALAGTSTTGLSQPITVGTSTSDDSSSRIGRAMCSRFASRATTASSTGAAAAVPRVFIRCTQSQPLARRSVSRSTPPTQHATKTGSQDSTSMPPRVRDEWGDGSRRPDHAGARGVPEPAGAWASAPPAAIEAGADAVSPRQTCTPVTTGTVAISDSAIVATT